MAKDANSPPGTIWLNKGRWWWKVRLPGEAKRGSYPLAPPGEKLALREDRGRGLAESIAWRMWERASRKAQDAPDGAGMTVELACQAFTAWAAGYYRRPDGCVTGQAYNNELALRQVRQRLGGRRMDEVGYADIRMLRTELEASGIMRATINQRVVIWQQLWKWALENGHCKATTKAEVCAIEPLKKYRSQAKEGKQQTPVRHRDVKLTLPFLPANVAAMVAIQELCGARPGEIIDMRACDVERRHGMWVYRPARHKNSHRDLSRCIVLGPRAQAILAPWLDRPAEAQVFHPRESGDGHGVMEAFTNYSYHRAIVRAIGDARRAGVTIPHWTPNQLRHACGTRVRRKFGAACAAAVLGHSNRSAGSITDRYTRETIEREQIAEASRAMRVIG